jgi:hypothetical protein
MTLSATPVSGGSTVELQPNHSITFPTNNGTLGILQITNESQANIANFNAACNTAKTTKSYTEQLAASANWSDMQDWGGGALVVVNTSNAANPATLQVVFTQLT